METLWHLFETQIIYRPRWVERHFPAMSERRRPEHTDFESMTRDQGEATRHLLDEQIMYFEARVRKERARSTSSVPRGEGNAGDEGELPVRVRLHREALENLCDVLGLSNPVSGSP